MATRGVCLLSNGFTNIEDKRAYCVATMRNPASHEALRIYIVKVGAERDTPKGFLIRPSMVQLWLKTKTKEGILLCFGQMTEPGSSVDPYAMLSKSGQAKSTFRQWKPPEILTDMSEEGILHCIPKFRFKCCLASIPVQSMLLQLRSWPTPSVFEHYNDKIRVN